jgi:hypothetical protein
VSGVDLNIDTMRRIDRLVGIPLCFLATIILKLAGCMPHGAIATIQTFVVKPIETNAAIGTAQGERVHRCRELFCHFCTEC